MTAEMIAPAWMHELVTAEQYDSWSEDQCERHRDCRRDGSGDPERVARHNRVAKVLANALEAAGAPDWNADYDFDVRLQDVPLINRRPDVVVYRARYDRHQPVRPEHVLLARRGRLARLRDD